MSHRPRVPKKVFGWETKTQPERASRQVKLRLSPLASELRRLPWRRKGTHLTKRVRMGGPPKRWFHVGSLNKGTLHELKGDKMGETTCQLKDFANQTPNGKPRIIIQSYQKCGVPSQSGLNPTTTRGHPIQNQSGVYTSGVHSTKLGVPKERDPTQVALKRHASLVL